MQVMFGLGEGVFVVSVRETRFLSHHIPQSHFSSHTYTHTHTRLVMLLQPSFFLQSVDILSIVRPSGFDSTSTSLPFVDPPT